MLCTYEYNIYDNSILAHETDDPCVTVDEEIKYLSWCGLMHWTAPEKSKDNLEKFMLMVAHYFSDEQKKLSQAADDMRFKFTRADELLGKINDGSLTEKVEDEFSGDVRYN